MASHPHQPLAPRHQAGARKSGDFQRSKSWNGAHTDDRRMSVKQEQIHRQLVDERVAEKLGKLHESVSAARQARKLKRQHNYVVELVQEAIKTAQEQ